MKEIEKKYHQLKGASKMLQVVEAEAKKALIEFVGEYGILSINTDGVPHTITLLTDNECTQHQIMQLEVGSGGDSLVVTTTDGERFEQMYAFDDLSYLIDDLSEECLEYAEPEKKNYIMVNVPGRHGYSFMVKTNYDLREDRIIELCRKQYLFQDEQDAEYAEVVSDVTEEDIIHHKFCTYDIDEKS